MNSYSLHIKSKDIKDGVYTLSLTLSKKILTFNNKGGVHEIAEFEAIYNSDINILDKKLEVDTKYISDYTILDSQDIAQFVGYSLSDFIKYQLYGYNEAHPKTYYYEGKYSERIKMCTISYMQGDKND